MPRPHQTPGQQVQRYQYQGVPGLIMRRTNRYTGTVAALYHAGQAHLPGGPYVLICEDHGTRRDEPNQGSAGDHLSHRNWCPDCEAILIELGLVPLEEP